MQSWKIVGTLSSLIETGFNVLHISHEIRRYFFVIRGPYPFYVFSSVLSAIFFYYYADESYRTYY